MPTVYSSQIPVPESAGSSSMEGKKIQCLKVASMAQKSEMKK